MCAFVRYKNPYTAVDDINVFKILMVKDGKLVTPFREEVIPEIPYTMVAEGESDLTNCDEDGYYHIEGGYIHSIRYIFDIGFSNSAHNIVLVKSHIPANSKYYFDRGLCFGMCSDKLVLDEIIPYDKAKDYCDAAPDSLIEEVLKHEEVLKREEVFEEEPVEELEEVYV